MAAYTPLDTWRVQDIPLPLFWQGGIGQASESIGSPTWPLTTCVSGLRHHRWAWNRVYNRADWAGGQVGKVRAPGGSDTTKTLLSNPTASTIHRQLWGEI